MLTISNSIQEAYNKYTTQRKSYIKVGDNSFFIENLDIQADTYDEGNIIGSAISKIAKFDIETINVKNINRFELFDGIWTGEQYEYISLGTFEIFDEQGVDDFYTSVTAYDKLILFNKPYVSEIIYPTTIYNLLKSVCSQAGVELENASIVNGEQILENELFVEQETLKTILKAICQISGTFGIISNDKLKLLLKGTETISLDNSQIANPEYKRTTWKINQVILGMKDVEGEFVLRQDDGDIALNGVHKLVINDNPFVYTQDLRQEYIDNLFEQIKGFGYVAFECNWEGMSFVELGDLLIIDEKESVVLRYNIKSPNGLESTLSAPSIIDSAIDYVNNKETIENRLKRTEIIVNKSNQTITEVVESQEGYDETLTELQLSTGNISLNISSLEEEVKNANQLILDVQNGVTNTFTTSGGNNIFRNTDLVETNESGYEYWNGPLNEKTNLESVNGVSILIQNGNASQTVSVPNGKYVIGFNYNKLIELTNASVKVNGTEYQLEENGSFEQTLDVTTNSIKVEFLCDTNDGYEVYDLRCNVGSVLLPYSQNPNEVRSSTVTIGKKIKIKSDTEDFEQEIGASGNIIYDSNGNEVTKLNGDGGWFKKIVVEDNSEISGLLIRKVEGQVWIDGL